jgi:hypothetical protein
MLLSSQYKNTVFYGMVYHTRAGGEEVEFISPKFFTSEDKAWKWFKRKFDAKDFLEVQCVEVRGFEFLTVDKVTLLGD